MARKHDGWRKAKDIAEFHKAHKGIRLSQYIDELHFVELDQAAYGDWTLFVDDDGNYYEDYFPIGD